VVASLAALLLVAVVLRCVLGPGLQLGRVAGLLTHPVLPWLALALACEVLSYLAYALAQRRLVRAAGHRLNARWLACLATAAQALSNFLPAGYLASNVLNFNEFRHRSLAPARATWVLLMSSVLYIGTLATLALIGAELGGGAAAGPVRYLGTAALGMMALLALLLLFLRRNRLLRERAVDAVVRLARLVPGRRTQWAGRTRGFLTSLSATRLSRRGIAHCAAGFAGCWVADAACLVASFFAMGAAVPWTTLLLAYCGAQLVSFMPITPGGVGLVEGSLALALVSGGAPGIHVLSAILLYRLISYWGTLPAGVAGYAVVRRTRPGLPDEERVASLGWPTSTISAVPSNN
jgi:uncharacterized protein (TIRG00374 family)